MGLLLVDKLVIDQAQLPHHQLQIEGCEFSVRGPLQAGATQATVGSWEIASGAGGGLNERVGAVEGHGRSLMGLSPAS